MNPLEIIAGFRLGFVTVCMLCGILPAAGQRLNSPRRPDSGLKAFLQRYLSDRRFGVDKTTRFSSASVQRSDGTIEEVVIYVSGQTWCGSGGCLLLVLAPRGKSYNIIGRTSIVWPPIRVLQSSTNGRRDIGVWVQGGGILPGYEAVLQFNGKKYPSNPTVPPARRLTGEMAGEMLIPTAEDATPLFE
jgi:hypothetical protein